MRCFYCWEDCDRYTTCPECQIRFCMPCSEAKEMFCDDCDIMGKGLYTLAEDYSKPLTEKQLDVDPAFNEYMRRLRRG